MRKVLIMTLLIYSYFIASCQSFKTDNNNKKAREQLATFPKAGKDEIRHVLLLPQLNNDEELNRKVEIFVGKMLEADCNLHHLDGKLEKESVPGYGYEYYIFKTSGEIESTLMLCSDAIKIEKFIHAPSATTYYDSSFPIVIYTPKQYEVRYKIWEAGNLQKIGGDEK